MVKQYSFAICFCCPILYLSFIHVDKCGASSFVFSVWLDHSSFIHFPTDLGFRQLGMLSNDEHRHHWSLAAALGASPFSRARTGGDISAPLYHNFNNLLFIQSPLKLFLIFSFIYLVHTCRHVHSIWVQPSIFGGQRANSDNWISSTVCVPGVKPRSSGLMVSTITARRPFDIF